MGLRGVRWGVSDFLSSYRSHYKASVQKHARDTTDPVAKRIILNQDRSQGVVQSLKYSEPRFKLFPCCATLDSDDALGIHNLVGLNISIPKLTFHEVA